MSSSSKQTYGARAQNHPNPLVKRLFAISEAKKTNVTVSADVTTTKELLDLADRKSRILPRMSDSHTSGYGD
jgi:orotidine-5'-phosphate decarboxylase